MKTDEATRCDWLTGDLSPFEGLACHLGMSVGAPANTPLLDDRLPRVNDTSCGYIGSIWRSGQWKEEEVLVLSVDLLWGSWSPWFRAPDRFGTGAVEPMVGIATEAEYIDRFVVRGREDPCEKD